MTQYIDQLNKVHDASMQFIESSTVQAEKLIKDGKYKEATGVLNSMVDGIGTKNTIVEQATKQRTEDIHKILNKPTAGRSSASILPQGISKGKMAAIVAGVTVVGGGILLYRHHQQKKSEPWTSRIDQERRTSLVNNLSR